MAITLIKICMLGDFAVGKTSLVRQFVDQQFSDQYISTVGVKISRKTLQLPKTGPADARQVQLILWDLAGSVAFKSITPSYLKGARGAIVVGDLTRQETLDHISDHIEQFRRINPAGHVVVALNKADLIDAHHPPAVPESGMRPPGIVLHQTSAKTGTGVDSLFETLSQNLVEVNGD